MADGFTPQGIYPILYSYFDRGGKLDRIAWRQQIEAVIEAGAQGIAILGLITEVSALTPDERRHLVEWAVSDIAGRVPLLATIAGRDGAETQRLAQDAEAAGANALIIQPPLGARPTEADLSSFYSSVMSTLSIPVGIQNAPEYLGVGLSPNAIRALAQRHKQFQIMKGEGPVSVVKQYIETLSPDIAIFNGRGGLELPDNLRVGCKGLVPAPDCADYQIAVFNALMKGNDAEADRLYREILPYIVFAMQSLDVAIAYGKRMFAHRVGIENECRCRVTQQATDPVLLTAMQRWSASFGPYKRIHSH